MDEYESLSHTKWECKYHVVFIPKCRRKTLYGNLRKHLGEVFRKLAEQKESRIEEGHLWGLSRAKVRSTWHGYTGSGSRTTRGRVSGRGDISCRRWAAMNGSFANTSATRNAKTSVWTR
jgi:hypothetical protein